MNQKTISASHMADFSSLYATLCSLFSRLWDKRGSNIQYSLCEVLKSAFAMFSLKHPSLLSFEHRSKAEAMNLKTIYGVDHQVSDSQIREVLDEVSPPHLLGGFPLLYKHLKKLGIVKAYRYYQDRIVLSIDGVEHFHSTKVHCERCLEKVSGDGTVHYSHSMLVGVLVHPEHREVFPLGCEPIICQDGANKQDCELNASKRLLAQLQAFYPKLNKLVVEDALYANGPHLRQLLDYGMSFIIRAKPDSLKSLFRSFESRKERKKAPEWEYSDEKGITHAFCWTNNLPLNSSANDLRVNMLHYTQIDKKGRKLTFAWVTNIGLTKASVNKVMRAGRARWKIENETFNTLKNQGYHFEHNYGHGYQHLASNLAILMLLAFFVDQIQQHSSKQWRIAWHLLKSKRKLWQVIQAMFITLHFESMEALFKQIKANYNDSS